MKQRKRFIKDLRLMVLIGARVGFLLQNARQILVIVRKTFPTLSFSEAQSLNDCALAPSAGETLSCLWSNAASLADIPGQIDAAAALHALTRVGDRASFCRFDC